jgi:hypothetical protein
MLTTYDHPLHLARSIAKLLEADLIASGQVKEHISRERLIELLGIEPEVVVETEYIKHDRIEDALRDFGDDELLRYVKQRFTRSEILGLVA